MSCHPVEYQQCHAPGEAAHPLEHGYSLLCGAFRACIPSFSLFTTISGIHTGYYNTSVMPKRQG